MKTLANTDPRAASVLLLVFLSSACHDDDDGGGGAVLGAFLENEAEVSRIPSASPGSGEQPLIRVDGTRIYVLWEDTRGGGEALYFNRSIDGGASWGAADVMIPGSDAASGDVDIAPFSLASSGESVYVAWEAVVGVNDDVFFSASHDGGTTWMATPVRLDTDASGAADSDEQHVECDGPNVYVAWVDDRDGALDVYFTRSADGGATWTPEERVDTDVAGDAESRHHHLAVDGASLYIVWSDARDGGSIRMNRSTDGGVTWLADDVRLDTGMGVGERREPRISADGALVYAAWLDGRDGDFDVYGAVSMDGGATWTPDFRIDADGSTADAEELDLQCVGASAYAVWKEPRSGEHDVFLNRTADAGATWLASDLRLDTDAPGAGDSDDPRMCVEGSNVVVCWEDDRAGFDDIRLNYSKDGGVTWLADDLAVERIAAGTQDADRPKISCSLDRVWVAWQDYRQAGDGADVYVNGGILP